MKLAGSVCGRLGAFGWKLVSVAVAAAAACRLSAASFFGHACFGAAWSGTPFSRGSFSSASELLILCGLVSSFGGLARRQVSTAAASAYGRSHAAIAPPAPVTGNSMQLRCPHPHACPFSAFLPRLSRTQHVLSPPPRLRCAPYFPETEGEELQLPGGGRVQCVHRTQVGRDGGAGRLTCALLIGNMQVAAAKACMHMCLYTHHPRARPACPARTLTHTH